MPSKARRVKDANTDVLVGYRAKLERAHRVRTPEQLVKLVDAAGFCFAFTGERTYPVPAAFDHLETRSEHRKWDWMWPWKDELPEKKRLYYGKLLVKKPTFVSMKLLPVFYATFGRAGEADDHLEDVRAGRLSDIARRVVEYLVTHGETQKKRMRADLGIESKEGRADLEKAIEELQRLMYVARVKAVGERSDDYNYTYDLFVRRYPEVVKAAERVSSADASLSLLERLLALAGGIAPKQIGRLFDWDEDRVARTIERAAAKRRAVRADGLVLLPALAAKSGSGR